MLAHAVTDSSLWAIRPEPQTARHDEVAQSLAASRGEAIFSERRRAVPALLRAAPDEAHLLGGHDAPDLVTLFPRMLDLPDAEPLDLRSAGRRVGKESGGTGRYRVWQYR